MILGNVTLALKGSELVRTDETILLPMEVIQVFHSL